MVIVTEIKENFVSQEIPSDSSLREERRRTGRYVATVIAIFVSLFGLYQAMARGTPEYAAFFLPALIMFLYILWILYASRARSKNSIVKDSNEDPSISIKSEAPTLAEHSSTTTDTKNSNFSTSDNTPHIFFRSYSVA